MKIGIDCIGISTSFYCHDGEGKWLLHKRSDKCRDEKGTWDSGGGKVEVGLTLDENVLKEIQFFFIENKWPGLGCKSE